jgi:hypothetical protein
MKKILSLLFIFLVIVSKLIAQNTKGIHIQAIARNQNGIIIPNKQITLRLSIINDTSNGAIEYQEIKSVTTNMLGLFFVEMGAEEEGKVITIGRFEKIPWDEGAYFIHVEVDPNNSLSFVSAGMEKMNYVPLALYAEKAHTVNSIIPVEFGGTGVASIKEMAKNLNIDKLNNTPDSIKPISIATSISLNEKLKKSDTIGLSNRINLKLNSVDTLSLSNKINLKLNWMDTIKLSNRINLKLNSTDTLMLSNRINSLSKIDTTSLSNRINTKASANYGAFYDTARQASTINTASAVKFYFQQVANKINVVANSSGYPTRISVLEPGIYRLNYNLQFIKSDIGSDEVNVWIRRNGSAYTNTNNLNAILGSGIKNQIIGNYYIELSANDYVELYYSIKNINSIITGTPSTSITPSRPATPSASISLHAIN